MTPLHPDFFTEMQTPVNKMRFSNDPDKVKEKGLVSSNLKPLLPYTLQSMDNQYRVIGKYDKVVSTRNAANALSVLRRQAGNELLESDPGP